MNPVSSIGGISVKTPSLYKLSMQDVSAPGAGRTLDATMQKKTVAKKIKIDIEWKSMTFSEATTLLNATSGEYFTATVLTLNGNFATKTFYRGDVTADLYGSPVNRWMPVKLSLIER